jgi:hypothetical protein
LATPPFTIGKPPPKNSESTITIAKKKNTPKVTALNLQQLYSEGSLVFNCGKNWSQDECLKLLLHKVKNNSSYNFDVLELKAKDFGNLRKANKFMSRDSCPDFPRCPI